MHYGRCLLVGSPLKSQVVLQDFAVALRSARSICDIFLRMDCVARIYELNIRKS